MRREGKAIFSKKKLQIDLQKCSLCQACTNLCPYGALRYVQNESSGLISFSSSKCKGDCSICQDKCPSQAIYFKRGELFASFFQKTHSWTINYTHCKKCGKLMEPGNMDYCHLCRREIACLKYLKNVYPLKTK